MKILKMHDVANEKNEENMKWKQILMWLYKKMYTYSQRKKYIQLIKTNKYAQGSNNQTWIQSICQGIKWKGRSFSCGSVG